MTSKKKMDNTQHILLLCVNYHNIYILMAQKKIATRIIYDLPKSIIDDNHIEKGNINWNFQFYLKTADTNYSS